MRKRLAYANLCDVLQTDDRKFVSVAEAAKLFHVHHGTVLRWIRTERLTAWKTPGGSYRIPRADVELLMAEATEAGVA